MAKLTLPPDLAGEAIDALKSYPDHPAVRAFFAQVRKGRRWDPHWPRRLLRLAEHWRVPTSGKRRVKLLCSGFGWRFVLGAVLELLEAKFLDLLETEDGMIYRDDRELLVWGENKPAPDPVAPHLPRPARTLGPIGPAPPSIPLSPASPATNVPAEPPPPRPPRGEVVTRRLRSCS
jgi:hypothetical protein